MSKTDKLKARRPRGFEDRGATDVAATEAMLEKIRQSFELFGFEPVETPFVEYTDALGKFLPDQDRPNEGVFSFHDDDGQWLSLRYDLTAPLARYVAENFDALPKPYRSYRAGYVFRNEKPGPGRFRQFMQFDADIVGAGSVAADAEACMLMADTLEAVGIKRGDYVIKVNNRKVLDGVMEAIGLGGEENAGRRLGVLRAIDKLDKFPIAEVEKLLMGGRLDESGDFTKGVGLTEDQCGRVLVLFSANEDAVEWADLELKQQESEGNFASSQSKKLEYLFALASRLTISTMDQATRGSLKAESGIQELENIERLVRTAGYGPDRIRIDPSIVRGLEYYTGPVFEAELTFPVTNEDGQVVRFGSVAGGGRYDGLVGRFRNDPVPATGFSIGVSRLYTALKLTNSPILAGAAKPGPVVVTVMDKDRIGDYQRIVSELRGAGIAAELYLGSSGFNAQMKYADKRRSPCVVIQGGDEKAAGTVQVKDLILGAELAKLSKEGKDREDYLERQKEAQFAVPEDALVDAVKTVLARNSS
ncbi:MAG: histidine--tRNA ligase [Hyphomicrobiales bacterium]|nr:histidine--tRNA ligase [Hyphomicrobiales bacterium]